MLDKLSLRLRIFLFFALQATVTLLLIGLALTAALNAEPERQLQRAVTYTGLAALLLAALSFVIWQLFDRYIARALHSLARDMENALHSEQKVQLDADALQYLGPVRPAATRLLHTINDLQRAHHDQHEADRHALRVHERRLAAIIRDLDQPLLMANREHRITLYNAAAERLIDDTSLLGIGRSLGAVVDKNELKLALQQLDTSRTGGAIQDANPARARQRLQLTRLDDPTRQLSARMGPILDTDTEALVGYLLLFDEHAPAETEVELSGRPEFYDFELFEREPAADLRERPLEQLNFVVFDTETTGLDPSGGDQIIQIAGVRVVNARVLEQECFDQLINPGRPIPQASIKFHGIHDSDVADASTALDVLPGFLRFAGDSVLVAHNAAFDMKFLSLALTGSQHEVNNIVLDTVLLSAWLQDDTHKHTLDDLAERYGVAIRGRHTALGDSLVTAEVLVAMLPRLAARGVHTLGEALAVCDRQTDIKKAQARY